MTDQERFPLYHLRGKMKHLDAEGNVRLIDVEILGQVELVFTYKEGDAFHPFGENHPSGAVVYGPNTIETSLEFTPLAGVPNIRFGLSSNA